MLWRATNKDESTLRIKTRQSGVNPEHTKRLNARSIRAAGFTVIEVLVAVAVIGVLIALMLPSISLVQESARKMVCASNTRQIGLGLNMFSNDNKDLLPPSVFLPRTVLPNRAQAGPRPELMTTIRTGADAGYQARRWGQWDGIGLLYQMDYLRAEGIYYCPSQRTTHTEEDYQGAWDLDGTSEIVSNYQFRGVGPNNEQRLFRIRGDAAIVTDSLRSFEDLNHEKGFNILQAGLSVTWSEGVGAQEVISLLLRSGGDDGGPSGSNSNIILEAWSNLDGGNDSPKDDSEDG